MAAAEDQALQIVIEVTIIDLSEEQRNRFGDYIEFWDSKEKKLYQDAASEGPAMATAPDPLGFGRLAPRRRSARASLKVGRRC